MGRFMAAELAATGFFRGIDVIIPVPLHPRKQKLRGYNQSECIARGVSAVTGIPIDVSSVLRRRHTETQTRKSAYERWENVDGIFLLRYPERFVGDMGWAIAMGFIFADVLCAPKGTRGGLLKEAFPRWVVIILGGIVGGIFVGLTGYTNAAL